jgi:hypothetical protein
VPAASSAFVEDTLPPGGYVHRSSVDYRSPVGRLQSVTVKLARPYRPVAMQLVTWPGSANRESGLLTASDCSCRCGFYTLVSPYHERFGQLLDVVLGRVSPPNFGEQQTERRRWMPSPTRLTVALSFPRCSSAVRLSMWRPMRWPPGAHGGPEGLPGRAHSVANHGPE